MFIVFEGPDGSGKTTQLDLLARILEDGGRQVVRTREPGGSPTLGPLLRQQLLHSTLDIGARAEALLFAADRAEHVRLIIEPAVRAGAVVLCDRFVDSTLIYQGAGRGLPADELLELARFATVGREPDLVVVCDIDAEQATRRAQGRSAQDRMESAQLDRNARQVLAARAAEAPQRYVLIDASGTIEQVHQRITAAVLPRLHTPPC